MAVPGSQITPGTRWKFVSVTSPPKDPTTGESINNTVLEKITISKQKIENTTKQNELIKQENKLLEKQNKEFAKRIAKLKKKK